MKMTLRPPSILAVTKKALLVTALSLLGMAAAPAAAPAAAEETSGSIVYSAAYVKLIAAYPSGWVPNECEARVFLSGGTGVCTAGFDPVYFYPDGTFGRTAWFVDSSSRTGWSVDPDPCVGLTDDQYVLWAAYVDFSAGYLDTAPELTGEQIDRYAACWGYWF